MLCKKCRREIPDNSKFCLECGAKQGKAAAAKRGNGQGCVFRRPSGTWAAEITLGYFIKDGKMKRKMRRKCGFKTKKEAVLYLDVLRQEYESPKKITLSQLWERYSDNWDLSQPKQAAYKIAWKKIENTVGWRKIDSLTSDELQDLVDSAAPSYYTRRDIKTVLSKLYQIAMRDDFTDKNKASFIKLPKLVTNERTIFTDSEISALWEDYNSTADKVTAALLVMLYTGMRPVEVQRVRTDEVHLSEHYMTGGAKTEKGKNRKIIIPDKLVPVIKSAVARSRKGLLFWYSSKNDIYEEWAEKRSELGLRAELTPYCARHTYITRLTALGVSPAMLKELAGHEDYETTLIYTHLSINDRLKEVNRL